MRRFASCTVVGLLAHISWQRFDVHMVRAHLLLDQWTVCLNDTDSQLLTVWRAVCLLLVNPQLTLFDLTDRRPKASAASNSPLAV